MFWTGMPGTRPLRVPGQRNSASQGRAGRKETGTARRNETVHNSAPQVRDVAEMNPLS